MGDDHLKKKKWMALALAATGSVLLYRRRWQLLQRVLGLPPAGYAVRLSRNLRVPVGEGITLAADHYAPVADGSFPTILIRTPYGRRLSMAFNARRFAERGYQVVVQDVRGRFGSEGEFQPFLNEVADGEATVEWLTEQPWYNGVLGMWGASYVGYVQWALATARPEAFRALVPVMASSRGAFTGEGQGTLHFELILRWMVLLDALNGLTGRGRSLAPWRAFWRLFRVGQNQVVRKVINHVPLQEVDQLTVGREIAHYRRSLLMEPPTWWVDTDRRPLLGRLEAPAHLVGGWYDFMLHDLLGDYAALQTAGRQPYLTIGPWHHLDWHVRGASLRLGLAWFDAKLKGKKERLRAEPVRVYVMGADEWRSLPSWPPPARRTRYYLHGEAGLARRQPPEVVAPDHYRYDPARPTPAVGGSRFGEDAGPRDNRALEARPDVLTYTTMPLPEAVEVIGPVRAVLFVRSSLAFTDFFARLCDVDPSGRSINLCDGLIRVVPGTGARQADGTLRLEVDMWATAHRFRQGQRIRLQLSSGAHPRYVRNLGTGDPPATATEMRVAAQTIYHDAAHPSALLLPFHK